jgi:hypothetical protein
MPRDYSSAATDDDAVSTEGIDFTIDGEPFVCHGRISAFDLSEFAGPASEAATADQVSDPAVVRMLADLMRMVLGDDTYRQVTKHRRLHRTPDSVMQQLLMDVVGAVGERPSARPSPSRGGRPPRVSSPAASPSPAGPAAGRMAALAALAANGDITFADPPPDGSDVISAPEPGTAGRIVRTLSLAHPDRPVRITTQTG